MLRLSSARPIASGDFRDCYRHPEDRRKCIKIVRQVPADHHLGRVDRLLGRAVADPNLREFAEYRRHLDAGVPLARYFPRLYGFVETDLGRGLCLDLFEGTDSLPPVSLEDCLAGKTAPDLERDFVLREYSEFARFCVEHAILASCDEPKNVGFMRDGAGYRLVAFDLKVRQNKELIPISTLFRFFRRRKIARRFQRTSSLLERRLKTA